MHQGSTESSEIETTPMLQKSHSDSDYSKCGQCENLLNFPEQTFPFLQWYITSSQHIYQLKA